VVESLPTPFFSFSFLVAGDVADAGTHRMGAGARERRQLDGGEALVQRACRIAGLALVVPLAIVVAVRQALKRLGGEAKPKALGELIRDQFHVTMEPTLISNYKSTILRKAAGQSKVMRKPGRSTVLRSMAASGFTLEEIQAVKQVVEQIGAEKVQQLAAVLAT
jgi:hypothetical protein